MSYLKGQQFFVCSCFFRRNIFLKEFKRHVEYEEESKFVSQYKSEFFNRYGVSEEKLKEGILPLVKSEVDKRRKRGQLYLERCLFVEQNYTPLHPQVYSLDPIFLDPIFTKVAHYAKSAGATREGLLSLISEESPDRTFSLPVFTQDFCKLLVEELEHFEESPMPKERPNTMNNYGLLLSEVGFDQGFMNAWREQYLQPIALLLYPEWCRGGLDSHRVFVVRYKIGEDLELARHFDNAEVTMNVSVGDVFEGGTLYFGRMNQEGSAGPPEDYKWFQHKLGTGLIHRGQQYHGALPIKSGTRYNLIMWMRSSQIRKEMCPMCQAAPKLVENIGYGDGFVK